MIFFLICCLVSGFENSFQQIPSFIAPSSTSLGFIPGAPNSASAAQSALFPKVGAPGLSNLPGGTPTFGLPNTGIGPGSAPVGAPAFSGNTGQAPSPSGASDNALINALAGQGLFPPTEPPNSGPVIIQQGLPDSHQFCCVWASMDQCDKNPAYMKPNCQVSCGTQTASSTNFTLYVSRVPKACQKVCNDTNTNCPAWAATGECLNNPYFMKVSCQHSCQSCGTTLQKLDSLLPAPTGGCVNRNTLCSYWTKDEQCQERPTYMKDNCCHSCKHIAIIRAIG